VTQGTNETRVPISWTLDYRHLKVGATYRVARAFRDFDRIERKEGDGWLYLGHNYFAREDGLTLYVAAPNGAFEVVRLQCTDDQQGAIDSALAEHLVAGEVAVDQAAFMRALAARIGSDEALHRELALELVARMPAVSAEVADAVVALLARTASDARGAPSADTARTAGAGTVALLMALYNVAGAAAAHRAEVEALRDALAGDEVVRAIAEAVLRKMA
jgi:hypothetical protein